MTLIHVNDDTLLEAHEQSNNDSLEETIDQALELFAELENAEEMIDLEDDRKGIPA
ncbi:hypothetical protein [Natrinema sp. DC36]|uniref:hypothetical protein n=1 Tax=Natrinema sp. DC36 TaxID=2878680 RepID=UPI001CF023EA|nr:hypothetical protein [Natrinema sp. DC36]